MEIWKEPELGEISTKNLIYFDKNHHRACRKICEVIGIDFFPDINEKCFWKFEDESWNPYTFSENQFVNPKLGCFDQSILMFLERNPSNLMFVKNQFLIEGVVHFTDYDKLPIYESLLRNLFVFERGLRTFLGSKNIGYDDFEKYYESICNIKNKFALKRLKELQNPRFKENARHYGSLQLLYLSELIRFSTDISNRNKFLETDFIDNLKEVGDDIIEVRNTIMHAKKISIWEHDVRHDFNQFKRFFIKINKLKSIFFHLYSLFIKKKEVYSRRLLKELNEIEDDNELRVKFMN
jgi:hypothetical protein